MARKHGISPWCPNQHGAWAMLIAPAVAVTVPAIAIFSAHDSTWRGPATVLLVLLAWFFGYFTFFALCLVAKARTPARRRTYARPLAVYGPVTGAAMVGALLAQPRLVVWALFFGPLMAVALWETFHGRPRSMASGISTTIASALLVPVLWMAAREASLADISGRAWLCFAFLALYFSGTVPLVKSMVRERKTPGFVRLSIGFHAAALGVFLLVDALAGLPWFAIVMALVLAVALLRAWWIPHSAAHGRAWTARKVGFAEVPLVIVAAVLVIATLWPSA